MPGGAEERDEFGCTVMAASVTVEGRATLSAGREGTKAAGPILVVVTPAA
ncbi:MULTISPECIES: hypothetical protein [unclassified Streptomyces]|nr:hypothetical protein [Streptomyces sp. TSRI0281]